MKLNVNNIRLLAFLYWSRVIGPEHIVALLDPGRKQIGRRRYGAAKTFRSSVAYKEVAFLVKEKFLRKWEGAYMLGPTSIPYMPEAEHSRKRVRNRILKSYPESGTVKHDLLITHLLVVLDMAKQMNPDRWAYQVRLQGEEPKLKLKGKYVKLDKLVTIIDRKQVKMFNYLVEADRSTAALQTSIPNKRNVRSRAVGFYQFHKSGGFPKHFGLKGCRLLFICPASRNERLKNIMATVHRAKEIPQDTNVYKYMTAEPWHLKRPERLVNWLCDVQG